MPNKPIANREGLAAAADFLHQKDDAQSDKVLGRERRK